MAGSANAGAARRRAARAATAIRFSIDIRSPEGRNNFSPATAVRTLRSTDSANFSRSRCRIRAVLKARAEELSPPAPAKGVYSDAAEGQSASVSNPTLLRIDVRFGSFAERRTSRRHVRSALRSGHRLMPKQRSVRAQAAATDVRG